MLPYRWRQNHTWVVLSVASVLWQAAGHWDFNGRLPAWRPDFPDYDCYREVTASSAFSGESRLQWDEFRREVHTADPSDWIRVLQAKWLHLLPSREQRAALLDGELPGCFLGVFFASLLQFAHCLQSSVAGASPTDCSSDSLQLLSDVIGQLLPRSPVELLLGTSWPLLAALSGLRSLLREDIDDYFACETVVNPLLDWRRLRKVFEPGSDWYRDGRSLVYDKHFQSIWVYAMDECPFGFAMIGLWKMVICAQTQGECVSQYSTVVDELIQKNSWKELVGNEWPLFDFLASVQRSLRRHEFRIDFKPEELQGRLPDFPHPLNGDDGFLQTAVTSGVLSPSFAAVLASVLDSLPSSYLTNTSSGSYEVRQLIYVTMVFGPQYVPYIHRFVSRAEALGMRNVALFCLDDAAMAACTSLPHRSPHRCIPGSPSILNKFTIPLAFLRLGIDVFWLDFDVFLLRDPTAAVLATAARRGVDLLVSGSFADDCICSGLVFLRSTAVVMNWLLLLLSWIYEHVYTHDQQAFSAFLSGRPDEDNATTPERISSSKLFKLYLNIDVPKWALLDPVVEFASARVLDTTGWTGDLDEMIIFHFLHGDSEVNREHNAYSWNAEFGSQRGDRHLLDIFYNQTDTRLYDSPLPPYRLSKEIYESLMESRRSQRPAMRHCGVLELKPYEPGRMNPDG